MRAEGFFPVALCMHFFPLVADFFMLQCCIDRPGTWHGTHKHGRAGGGGGGEGEREKYV